MPASPIPRPASAVADAPAGRPGADPRVWLVVPCAGSGIRAAAAADAPGSGVEPLAKQYRRVAGVPLVLHTLQAFACLPDIAGAVVVVAADDRFWAGVPLPGPAWHVVPCGGATRAASVGHGIEALRGLGAQPRDWVLVHDAARCLVRPEQVQELIDTCRHDAVGGLLAQPVSDTVKVVRDGRVASTLDRSDKWLAQTPQMFRLGLLADALAQAGSAVTDESSAVEALGLRPRIIDGGPQNMKVTWPGDFLVAEALLAARAACAGQAAGNTDEKEPPWTSA